MKKSIKFLKYIIISFIFLFLLFFLLDFLFPLDKYKLYRPQSVKIISQNGKVLRMALSKDGFWRFDASSDEIPTLLKKSVILFEDKWFYYHFGINPVSILRAFYQNLVRKKTIGASTITMQVARMMQRRERTYANKLIEMFNALQLQFHFSKDEILTFYLNLAPYGGNIEGIKAASYFYFKKPLESLSIAQIALLTTIPKNPNINRLDKKGDLKTKRRRAVNLLYTNKIINKSASLRANAEEIKYKRFKAPFYVPHYTNIAIKNKTQKVKINFQIQQFIEKVLKNAVEKVKHLDLNNAAAILIDNENLEVIAYVGSEDFKGKLGQNDGVLMVRTPGSTLKPFVYAKAFDLGILTPKRELYDLPLHFGYYTPENFNKEYLGKVTATEALQFSLNVPAVELNNILGKNSLYEILKSAKITSLDKEKEYYGNSIALGGFGISLLDLAHLYTSFANDGKLLPLKFAGKIIDKNITLMSKESAWLVSNILSDGIRPQFSEFWESAENMPRIGFKTGTSADSKDLYTIGYTKDYTFGVWMGNFDGSKTEKLTGTNTASKVVFEVFRRLNLQKKLTWFDKPKNIIKKKVCTDTIIKDTCLHEEYDFTIKGVNATHHCSFLRGEVLAYLIKNKMIKSINDFSSNPCFYEWKEKKPLFVSPYNGAEFLVDKKLRNIRKFMLQCYSFDENQKVYFKIDDEPFFQANSGEKIFIRLDEGYHELNCLDSLSKITTNKIQIKEQ